MSEIDTLPAWEYPDSYIGEDYTGYHVLYSIHRDSDLIDVSNHESILKTFQDHDIRVVEDYRMNDNPPDVIDVRASHWAVGWIDTIMVHHDADPKAIDIAVSIHDSLSDYPILDDEDYSNREYEMIIESYDQWIESEFMGLLKSHFDLYDIEPKDGICTKDLFDLIMDRVGSEYIVEGSGVSVYRIEEYPKHTDLDEVKEYFDIEMIG